MFLSASATSGSWLLLASVVFCSCGGRSGIPDGKPTEPLVPCKTDAECFDGNLCVTRLCQSGYCKTIDTRTCDDGDPCTADSCEPSTGECAYQSRVADNDGDGFMGALPGTVAGTPGSCGDDCNDNSASIHPGAPEVCDGVDNNCNGVIDEGVDSYNPFTSPIQISDASFTVGAASDITYDGTHFAISWTGQQNTGNFQSYISGYNDFGVPQIPATNISQTSNNSYGGPLIWTGSVFATAWEVRAEKGYDIFFSQLDVNGKKLGPDLRITDNQGFSVEPALLWNGTEYWIVWADDNGGDLFQIYGHRIDTQGQVSTASVLTTAIVDARTPRLVRGPSATLLVYLSGSSQRLLGQLLKNDLTPDGSAFYITGEGAYDFSVDWVKDRFVIAWNIEQADIGNAIWASTIDPNGNVITSPTRISDGATFARSPSVLSLGDRFALAWSDDRIQYQHYGIRFRTFDTQLNPLVPVASLVETTYDCIYPSLSAGGSGLALVYRNRIFGNAGQPFFLPLVCSGGLGF